MLLRLFSDACVKASIIQPNTNYDRDDSALKRHLLNPICETHSEKQASEKFSRVSQSKRLKWETLDEIQRQ